MNNQELKMYLIFQFYFQWQVQLPFLQYQLKHDFKIVPIVIGTNNPKQIESIAKALVERKDIYFTIQGHVCCTQNSRDAVDRKTNLRNLSEARAQYIYDYFAKKGVDKKRMKHTGLRRKFPLGGDPKFDRRVEILITYVGK